MWMWWQPRNRTCRLLPRFKEILDVIVAMPSAIGTQVLREENSPDSEANDRPGLRQVSVSGKFMCDDCDCDDLCRWSITPL